MPDPLCAFVGQGAALTAAAWAAAAANADGGGPFQRLGEGRGAALREAWTAEAVRTVPAERRAAAGDADELFTYARPPTKRERLEKGERRAEQHQGWADAPKEKRRRAAEEQTAAQAALLGPLAAADTTASLGGAPMRRPSAIVAAVLHQPIAAERAAPMLAPLGYHMNRLCGDVLKRWREFEREMNRSDEDGGDAVMRSSWANGSTRASSSASCFCSICSRAASNSRTRRGGRGVSASGGGRPRWGVSSKTCQSTRSVFVYVEVMWSLAARRAAGRT